MCNMYEFFIRTADLYFCYIFLLSSIINYLKNDQPKVKVTVVGERRKGSTEKTHNRDKEKLRIRGN